MPKGYRWLAGNFVSDKVLGYPLVFLPAETEEDVRKILSLNHNFELSEEELLKMKVDKVNQLCEKTCKRIRNEILMAETCVREIMRQFQLKLEKVSHG